MVRQDWNDCKERDTFRQPSLSFLPMPSFQRRLACMDAGGRAASGRKAEESSGLNNPFPRSGNDNQRNDNRTCYPQELGAY